MVYRPRPRFLLSPRQMDSVQSTTDPPTLTIVQSTLDVSSLSLSASMSSTTLESSSVIDPTSVDDEPTLSVWDPPTSLESSTELVPSSPLFDPPIPSTFSETTSTFLPPSVPETTTPSVFQPGPTPTPPPSVSVTVSSVFSIPDVPSVSEPLPSVPSSSEPLPSVSPLPSQNIPSSLSVFSLPSSSPSVSELAPSSLSVSELAPSSVSDPASSSPSFSQPPSVSELSPSSPSVSEPSPSASDPLPSSPVISPSIPIPSSSSPFEPSPSVPFSLSPSANPSPSASAPFPSVSSTSEPTSSSDPDPNSTTTENDPPNTTRRPGSPGPITRSTRTPSSSESATTNPGILGTETSRPNAFANNTGAIIGLALGVLGFILLVGLAAFFLGRRVRRHRSHEQLHSMTNTSSSTRPLSRNGLNGGGNGNGGMPTRSMTLVEDDDMHDSASATTSEMMLRGLPGIINALDIGDQPRPGPSVRGTSTPYHSASEENEQAHHSGASSASHIQTVMMTTVAGGNRRGSVSRSAKSLSIYSDPPQTPMVPSSPGPPPHGPSAYTYSTDHLGNVESSAGHGSSSGSHQRARTPVAPLGGSFRPKSPSPSQSDGSEGRGHRRRSSLFARLRSGSGSKKASPPGRNSSSEERLPPVPGILVSPYTPTTTPGGTIVNRGRPSRPGSIPFEGIQYPDLPPHRPPWTPYILPPEAASTTSSHEHDSDLSGPIAPAGLLRTDVERRTNDSRTSLGDHVDWSRPTLGVVFNRMASTATFETRTSGSGRRGDDGHSIY